jgi:hypothetical protein
VEDAKADPRMTTTEETLLQEIHNRAIFTLQPGLPL